MLVEPKDLLSVCCWLWQPAVRGAQGERGGQVKGGQTGTGASICSLQMNGDKSTRAIDPLVKAPLRLQPNVLKKETSDPVGALGGRQSSSNEAPPTGERSIDRAGRSGHYLHSLWIKTE